MTTVLSRLPGPIKALARPFVGTVTHVATSDSVAALTFDDGPDPEYTPRLLEVLERHGARATFFMVGERARRHPDLVARVAAAGHAIGNHSWDHPSFAHITSRARRHQVRSCARALAPHGVRLFRPPGGLQTPRSVLDVRFMNHDVVGWSIDPRDYVGRSALEIRDHVVERLRPGSIVVLHDALYPEAASDRSRTVDAVDRILEAARPRYEFVTLPELFRRGRRRRIHAFWRPERIPFDGSAAPGPGE